MWCYPLTQILELDNIQTDDNVSMLSQTQTIHGLRLLPSLVHHHSWQARLPGRDHLMIGLGSSLGAWLPQQSLSLQICQVPYMRSKKYHRQLLIIFHSTIPQLYDDCRWKQFQFSKFWQFWSLWVYNKLVVNNTPIHHP